MQGSARRQEIGLKIRIEQSHGGSSPPPGTILQLRYVVQYLYLNEHLDALISEGLRRNRLNLDTNSGTVRILCIQCGTTHPFLQRVRPYTKFIPFTLDYGMRCGSLCEFSYQASLSLRSLEATQNSTPAEISATDRRVTQ